MHAIVLAATADRALNAAGRTVIRPLLDLDGEPLLTVLVRRLAAVAPPLTGIHVVTNSAAHAELEAWAAGLPAGPAPVRVLDDGTTPPEARGAVGDLLFALDHLPPDDVLVLGGDNWFSYDLASFVAAARGRSPAVVVTPYRPGWNCSRFGVAGLGVDGRLTAFQEKPESTTLPFVAACVYYFAADDLAWLRRFAQEHSTACSPGTFVEWLVSRAPVYGVRLDAVWYDIGVRPGTPLRGPDFLQFRDALRQTVDPKYATWERSTIRKLQWITSYEDLLEVLDDPDPNRRIVSARLLGTTQHLLSEAGKEKVVRALEGLLADPAENEYEYAAFQSDEDSAVFVSATAAEALVQLGYAESVPAVYAKARAVGVPVAECRNLSA